MMRQESDKSVWFSVLHSFIPFLRPSFTS